MTVLTICNICLTTIEDEPVQDLTDSKGGVWCDRSFDAALASTLRLFPWNFNAKWTTLSASVSAPPFRYDYSYRTPDDLLDLRAVLDPDTWKPSKAERELVGRNIYTDLEAPLYIKYGRLVTRNELDNPLSDIYPLDPLFEECVAYKLGTFIAKAITGEQGDREYMEQKLQRALLDAAAKNEQNNLRHAIEDADDWTDDS